MGKLFKPRDIKSLKLKNKFKELRKNKKSKNNQQFLQTLADNIIKTINVSEDVFQNDYRIILNSFKKPEMNIDSPILKIHSFLFLSGIQWGILYD